MLLLAAMSWYWLPPRKAVALMISIRPEVLAFVNAAQELLSSDTARLPLSDHEIEQVAECLAKVEQALHEGES
jgi:hypothetical protein